MLPSGGLGSLGPSTLFASRFLPLGPGGSFFSKSKDYLVRSDTLYCLPCIALDLVILVLVSGSCRNKFSVGFRVVLKEEGRLLIRPLGQGRPETRLSLEFK